MHLNSLIRRGVIVAAAVAIGGATLVAAPTAAQAAPTLGTPTVTTAATTIMVPTQFTTYNFSLTFSGTAASSSITYAAYDSKGDSANAVRLDGAAPRDDSDSAPLDGPFVLEPNKAAIFKLQLDQYTNPGRYRLTFPITQEVDGTPTAEVTGTINITIVANPAITLDQSGYRGYGKFSKKSKWVWQYQGPDYLAGGTVKVYYKAKGKKKYVKIASAKIPAGGYVKFKSKKGAIRKTGYAYLVISGAPYCAQVKTPVGKLVRV